MISGGSNRGNNNGGSDPSQIILNGDGTNYDQRSPKEVTPGGSDLLVNGLSNVDPNTLQILENEFNRIQTGVRTENSRDGSGNQDEFTRGTYGLQQHGTRNYKGMP